MIPKRVKKALYAAGYSIATAEGNPQEIFSHPAVDREIKKRQHALMDETQLSRAWIVRRLMALDEANDSKYGLQAGLFTRDVYKIQKAWDVLEVGGIIVGDVPSWRADHMPYGGVKDSGIGREGVLYAIEHMTEPRLLVLRNPSPDG